MNNNIGTRIRKLREEKGISQDVMALELEVTQSNYGRLEKDDSRLTAPKLLKIAEVLQVSVSYLFNEQTARVINQHNNENPYAYIENLHQDKNLYEKLVTSYESQLASLKEEIGFLRKLAGKGK